MECVEVRLSRHAVQRMFERSIPPSALLHVLRNGEVVASYPDDQPYPSRLLLGYWQEQPVHVVVARDDETGVCWVITVYRPDPQHWSPDFKRRREA